jgi:hypothetical protein
MKTPEEALAAARKAAASPQDAPESGASSEEGALGGGSEWALEDPSDSPRRLIEWAIIDPELARVYSTRRYGQPITLLKRLLVRFLAQYLNEVAAQQSRFNALVAAHVMRLEERVAELERRAHE